MVTGPILVHLWKKKMMFNNIQMPSKRKTIKKNSSNRKRWWIIIKVLIYIARLIVKFLGNDDFDDPSNLV